MQTNLSPWAKTLPRAQEAERILRSCVHCGFCNATCPTYLDQGNELDGPRGRIYLIKNLLEGEPASPVVQQHLDRCLTCRNCETTCPSGVNYHALLDIGRAVVEDQVKRPFKQRLKREALKRVVPEASRFQRLLKVGQLARPLLPASLAEHIPAHITPAKSYPMPRHERKIMLLDGCVQSSLSPNTNAATARVLDRLGVSVHVVQNATCCGATDYHLNEQEKGLQRARRNIDAWWPALEKGCEAIVQTASGCGAFVKEYGSLLSQDPDYAAKAQVISAKAVDLVEYLEQLDLEQLDVNTRGQRLAFHCPCSLQHAQKLSGRVEGVLQRLGFTLTAVPDGHLCCGSAGTYSITEPDISRRLRDRKMAALESDKPDVIATANIGCQMHLQGAGRTPVHHWIELLEQALEP